MLFYYIDLLDYVVIAYVDIVIILLLMFIFDMNGDNNKDTTQPEKTNVEPLSTPIETTNVEEIKIEEDEKVFEGKENLVKNLNFGSTLQS